MFLSKRYFLAFLSLVIIINASENSRFNKDFFDELGVKNTPIIINKNKHIETEANEINENISWRLFSLLLEENEFFNNKKYRGAVEAMGIEYLDQSKYDSSSARMPIIPKHQLVLHERYFYERYYYCIEQKCEAPWYMKYISDKVGHGIFAAADIKKGDYIGDYTGILYDSKVRASRNFDPNYTWNIIPPVNSGIKEVFLVDAKFSCNFTRFINHSFDPNVVPINIYGPDGWHLIYVAYRDIKKDEQILVNYGPGYWKDKNPEKLN
jgi:hypothetical protein